MFFLNLKNSATSTINITNISKSSLMQKLVIAMFAIAIAFNHIEVKAQMATPAIEVTNDRAIKIGPNDNNKQNNRFFAFGQPPTPSASGMFEMGIYDSTFFIKGWQGNTPLYCLSLYTTNNYAVIGSARVGIGITLPQYKLDVNGDLNVRGNIRINGSSIGGSDRRFKKDIKPISNFDDLFRINSVQYKSSSQALREKLELFKQSNKDMDEQRFNATVSEFEQQIAEKDADQRTYFGVIAQDLRNIYPDLVYEDNQGYLSVNYTGLIPVMLDAIKELKTEVDALKGGVDKKNTAEVFSTAKLYQNNPNPFTDNTEIRFYIPDGSRNAFICIYDMVGSHEVWNYWQRLFFCDIKW